jgi:hypothetical protein
MQQINTMKKVFLLLVPVIALAGCIKCYDDGVCTEEFRTIGLKVESPNKTPVALDSSYTIRVSNNERIRPQQSTMAGYYVVLDDSYHAKLKKAEDDFRFVGWRNNQVVVDQAFRIAGDNCHIIKRSGPDSVTVQ